MNTMNSTNNMNGMNIMGYDAYIFDLDGCVYFNNEPARAAADLVALLQGQGKETIFLSNNSSHSPEFQRRKLAGMGIETEASRIYLASTITGRYLREKHGACTVCVAGAEGLEEQLRSQAHVTLPLNGDTACEFLVVGRDPFFSMQRLEDCAERIRQGARLIATNLDTYQPTAKGGKSPETGALVAAISAMTTATAKSVGKPDTYAFQCILKDFGLSPRQCLMIGDNLSTDVLGARLAGLDACWLTLGLDSGHTAGAADTIRPTFAFESLHALYQAALNAVPPKGRNGIRQTT